MFTKHAVESYKKFGGKPFRNVFPQFLALKQKIQKNVRANTGLNKYIKSDGMEYEKSVFLR